MDQFGKDHDKEILRKVADEARRKNKPHAVETTQSNVDMCTTSVDVSKHEKHHSANEGKKILDSLSQIVMNTNQLDAESTFTGIPGKKYKTVFSSFI